VPILKTRTQAQQDGGGTPQYLAPEAAIGQIPDGRADVYALGSLPFEMVTGTLPFTAAW
jgi:serine/threonine protein kinase